MELGAVIEHYVRMLTGGMATGSLSGLARHDTFVSKSASESASRSSAHING
jgi:hypothetical protein